MTDCTIERRKLVTVSALNIWTGAMRPKGSEIRVEPCGTPLFDDRLRRVGACRGCLKGWQVEGNEPTAAGLEQIAVTKAKIDELGLTGELAEVNRAIEGLARRAAAKGGR